MKIRLISVGKSRGSDANSLTDEYAKRLGRYCRFETSVLKTTPTKLSASKSLSVVFDPSGRQLDSEDFARLIERSGQDIDFYIGGADGFSDQFRQQADHLVSLSKLTFPHELARAVAAEQIYRAFTIISGHPYPR